MRSRKKRQNRILTAAAAVLVLLILALGGFEAYRIYGPSRTRMSEEELFGVSGEKTAILYQYELQKAFALTKDGVTYLPVEWVQSILNKRFYWDEAEQLLVYALPEEVVKIPLSEADDAGKPLMLYESDKLWLSTGLISSYTDIRIEVFNGGDVKRVFLESAGGTETSAAVRGRTFLRSRPSIKGDITADAAARTELRFIPDHAGSTADPEKWQRVMTPDGFTGYVQKKRLYAPTEHEVEDSFVAPVYTSLSLQQPVLLGWHQVLTDRENSRLENLSADARGMNVISPTWFTLKGNEGSFDSTASAEYVAKAHAAGLQVWPLISNLDDSVTLGTVLAKTSVREKIISELMSEADLYGFDGINIDFELLKKSAVKQYLEFIRELSAACRTRGLYLSVDVPNAQSYNWHYDRTELGVFCDYVINMGYDEHTSGDDPGSTSSISFFREGLEQTVDAAGAAKTIAAVPFYTRLWKTDQNGKVTSEAMSQGGAADWVEKNGVKLEWDETCGQYTGELRTDSGDLFQIWMEDAKSMQLKKEEVRSAGAGGIACWRLGLETKDMWEILSAQ